MRIAAALSLFALSSPTTTAAGTCAPRAHVDGDRDAVVRVSAELERLGVATSPAPAGCTAVEAAVQLEGNSISVAIRDGARSEGRVVGDPAIAAAWIDSWVRDDLAGFDDAAPAAMPLVQPQQPERDEPPPAIAARASVLDQIALRGGYAHAWTTDGSSWDGFDVAGCVRVGFACVGARATALFQSQLPIHDTIAARSDLSALATASTSIAIGRMAIVPEIGLGVGRLDTSRVDGCKVQQPPGCTDPTTGGPNCNPPPPNCVDSSGAVYVGDHLDATSYAPRAAASLRVAVPLFEHVWLEGGASVVANPFRHGAPFQPMPGTIPPNGAGADLSLPGESAASYQVGVGLRIGTP